MAGLLGTVSAACAPLVDALLFMPTRMAPERLATLAAQRGLQPWMIEGVHHGLVAEPSAERPFAGTVLVFHGNAGSAIDRTYYVAPLASRGLRVVLAEYPGYGAREGAATLSGVLVAAAATLQAARDAWPGPMLLLGESLGAGVIARLAASTPAAVDAVVLVTPWASLTEVAKQHFPWLPVAQLIPDPMDSIAALRTFGKPIAVLVAERDEIIGAAQGVRLAAELGVSRLVRLPGVGHNDWLRGMGEGEWSVLIGR